jgi:hypothetical protein
LLGLTGTKHNEFNRTARPNRQIAPEYDLARVAAPPAAVSSVTEHTTRNFDQHRFGEQNARE